MSKIEEILDGLGISNNEPNVCRIAKIEKRKSGNRTDEECLKSNCEFYDALHFMVGYSAPKNDTSTNLVTKRTISNHLYIFYSCTN